MSRNMLQTCTGLSRENKKTTCQEKCCKHVWAYQEKTRKQHVNKNAANMYRLIKRKQENNMSTKMLQTCMGLSRENKKTTCQEKCCKHLWAYQAKTRNQHVKKNAGKENAANVYGLIKRKQGNNRSRKMLYQRKRQRWFCNTREDMTIHEIASDMTENRQHWNMMMKTCPQR